MSRSPVFDDAALAEAALKFVATLHRTGGYSKEEIKNAFHPKMIDAYFKLLDKQEAENASKKSIRKSQDAVE